MSVKKPSSQLPHACGICGDLCRFGSLGIKISAFLKSKAKLKKHLLFHMKKCYFSLKASQILYNSAALAKFRAVTLDFKIYHFVYVKYIFRGA